MKLILKNSNLVFAQGIQNITIPIQPTTGEMFYWSPMSRETISWDNSDTSNKAITTGSKYQRSQIIDIDRTKYNAFKIVTSNSDDVSTYVWFAFSGSNKSQVLIQRGDIKVNTKYDFRTATSIFSSTERTLDGQLSSIYAGEKACRFAFSVKNDGTAPSMTAEEFAAITIVLMAE